MWHPAYVLLAVCLTAAAAYGLGTQHRALVRRFRSVLMSNHTRPQKPRPVGRHVRQQLQEVEMDLGAADRELEQLGKHELGDSRAQTFIGKALIKVARILGLGVDETEGATLNNG